MTFLDVEFDTAPQVMTVPGDLADALEEEPRALRFFAGLSYEQQRSVVHSVESAQTAAARLRRVEQVVGMLREERTR